CKRVTGEVLAHLGVVVVPDAPHAATGTFHLRLNIVFVDGHPMPARHLVKPQPLSRSLAPDSAVVIQSHLAGVIVGERDGIDFERDIQLPKPDASGRYRHGTGVVAGRGVPRHVDIDPDTLPRLSGDAV